MEVLTIVALLVAVIIGGALIPLALGAAGLLGSYLEQGGVALFLGLSSAFGKLNSFELIGLLLFALMGIFFAVAPIRYYLVHIAIYWLSCLRGRLTMGFVGASAIFGAVSGIIFVLRALEYGERVPRAPVTLLGFPYAIILLGLSLLGGQLLIKAVFGMNRLARDEAMAGENGNVGKI